MMVPIQPMNDEGSIQLSTLKQIIQQRKKKYDSLFLRFVWCKNSCFKKSSHTQKLPFLQLNCRDWVLRDFIVLNESISRHQPGHISNRHLHHPFIKRNVQSLDFVFLCACSLNGGNYLNSFTTISHTIHSRHFWRLHNFYTHVFSWIQTCSGYNWILEKNGKVAKAFNTCPQLMTTTQDFTKSFIGIETLKADVLLQIHVTILEISRDIFVKWVKEPMKSSLWVRILLASTVAWCWTTS